MTTVEELKGWINSLKDDSVIAIDEGGLTLQAQKADGSDEGYYEVGGWPLPEEADNEVPSTL